MRRTNLQLQPRRKLAICPWLEEKEEKERGKLERLRVLLHRALFYLAGYQPNAGWVGVGGCIITTITLRAAPTHRRTRCAGSSSSPFAPCLQRYSAHASQNPATRPAIPEIW